jgi:hypothetical protein
MRLTLLLFFAADLMLNPDASKAETIPVNVSPVPPMGSNASTTGLSMIFNTPVSSAT